MFFHTGQGRDWFFTLTNVGNKDVIIDLDYEILKPGLNIPSTAWEVTASDSETLLVGVPVEIRFEVLGIEIISSLLLGSRTKVNHDAR